MAADILDINGIKLVDVMKYRIRWRFTGDISDKTPAHASDWFGNKSAALLWFSDFCKHSLDKKAKVKFIDAWLEPGFEIKLPIKNQISRSH